MSISYDPLWKMLRNFNINKMEFAKRINISNATLAKLGKNEPVTLTIIDKICEEFSCNIEQVVKSTSNKSKDEISFENISVGTIIESASFPVNTSMIRNRKKHLSTTLYHCVVLTKNSSLDGKINYFLIAPISYDTISDTIFNVQFESVKINTSISDGYIQLDRIGLLRKNTVKSVIGEMPKCYVDKSLDLLHDLKGLMIKHQIFSEIAFENCGFSDDTLV